MVVFQGLTAFFLVVAIKAEQQLHIPTQTTRFNAELYQSQAYQDFKEIVRTQYQKEKFAVKKQVVTKDQKEDKETKGKIQNLLYDLSQESLKINQSRDDFSVSVSQSLIDESQSDASGQTNH